MDNKNNNPFNILWVCTDSQRWDTLGCYGNPYVHTPNIDRLAQRGVLFNHCYAQNPLCTPSRGAFLTGRYPVTNKLRQNGQNIPASETLVTKILSDNGYICGLSGKLHISACDHRLKLGPEWWRHDESEFFSGVEPRIDDGYTEFYWDHAPSARFKSSSYIRWLREKGVEFKQPEKEGSVNLWEGMPEEHHQTTFCVEKAIDFLNAYADEDDPWLFSVNIFDPHFKCDPPDKYLQPYLDKLDEIPLPDYVEGELENKPPHQKQRMQSGPYAREKLIEHDHRMIRAAYWAMCDLIDVQVGRLIDALEASGQSDNTIIIFTSDHGELLGDHGMYIKGSYLYDVSMRVPLIISCPGTIPEGKVTDALVELSDLAPTVLDAANLPRHPGMQTRSLWPILNGEQPLDHFRDDIYAEYYNSNPDKTPAWRTMLRTGKWKIILCHGEEIGELYDMENDPKEHTNLWDDTDYRDIKLELTLRAADRMAWTADPMPERIGIY
jgi:arylsulfatase